MRTWTSAPPASPGVGTRIGEWREDVHGRPPVRVDFKSRLGLLFAGRLQQTLGIRITRPNSQSLFEMRNGSRSITRFLEKIPQAQLHKVVAGVDPGRLFQGLQGAGAVTLIPLQIGTDDPRLDISRAVAGVSALHVRVVGWLTKQPTWSIT